jgi:hypothetical protein
VVSSQTSPGWTVPFLGAMILVFWKTYLKPPMSPLKSPTFLSVFTSVVYDWEVRDSEGYPIEQTLHLSY